MYSTIHLLLTRKNPDGQGVCHHSQLIGVESKTRGLNVMPRAVMAAKSCAQTATWPYGGVQAPLSTAVPIVKLSIVKAVMGHGKNIMYWVFPTADLGAGTIK